MSAEPAAKTSDILRDSSHYVVRRGPGMSATPPVKALRQQGEIVFEHQESPLGGLWKKDIRALMIQCCSKYSLISTDQEVLGGIPHLKGTRISVGQLLGRVCMLESIQGVVDYYQSRISSDQIKEALAYAQDFIETACEPPEDHG